MLWCLMVLALRKLLGQDFHTACLMDCTDAGFPSDMILQFPHNVKEKNIYGGLQSLHVMLLYNV